MGSLVKRVQHLEKEMLFLKNKNLKWDVKYQKLKANIKIIQYNLTSKVEAQERILKELVLAAGMQPSSAYSNSTKHGTSKNRQANEVDQKQLAITMWNEYSSKFSVRDEDDLNSLYTDGSESNEIERCRKKNGIKETVYNENYDNSGAVEVCFDADEQWEQDYPYYEDEYMDQQYWSGLDGSNGQSYITADKENGVEREFNFLDNTHAFHDYSMWYEGQPVTQQEQHISINRGEKRTVKQSENESASEDIQVRKKKKLRKNKNDSESAVAITPNAETVKTSKKKRTVQDNSAQLARTFEFTESNILQKSKKKNQPGHRKASSVLTDQTCSTDTVEDVSEIEISKKCGNTEDCINNEEANETETVKTSKRERTVPENSVQLARTSEFPDSNILQKRKIKIPPGHRKASSLLTAQIYSTDTVEDVSETEIPKKCGTAEDCINNEEANETEIVKTSKKEHAVPDKFAQLAQTSEFLESNILQKRKIKIPPGHLKASSVLTDQIYSTDTVEDVSEIEISKKCGNTEDCINNEKANETEAVKTKKRERTVPDNSAQLARTSEFSESNILQKRKIKIPPGHRKVSSVLTDQIYSTDTVEDVSQIEISKKCGNTEDCINNEGANETEIVKTCKKEHAVPDKFAQLARTSEFPESNILQKRKIKIPPGHLKASSVLTDQTCSTDTVEDVSEIEISKKCGNTEDCINNDEANETETVKTSKRERTVPENSVQLARTSEFQDSNILQKRKIKIPPGHRKASSLLTAQIYSTDTVEDVSETEIPKKCGTAEDCINNEEANETEIVKTSKKEHAVPDKFAQLAQTSEFPESNILQKRKIKIPPGHLKASSVLTDQIYSTDTVEDVSEIEISKKCGNTEDCINNEKANETEAVKTRKRERTVPDNSAQLARTSEFPESNILQKRKIKIPPGHRKVSSVLTDQIYSTDTVEDVSQIEISKKCGNTEDCINNEGANETETVKTSKKEHAVPDKSAQLAQTSEFPESNILQKRKIKIPPGHLKASSVFTDQIYSTDTVEDVSEIEISRKCGNTEDCINNEGANEPETVKTSKKERTGLDNSTELVRTLDFPESNIIQKGKIKIHPGHRMTSSVLTDQMYSKDTVECVSKIGISKKYGNTEDCINNEGADETETVKTSKKERTVPENSAQLARTSDFPESNILQKSKIKIHPGHLMTSSVLTDQIYSTDRVEDVSEIDISKKCGNTENCINNEGTNEADHVTTSGQYSASDMSGSEIASTQEGVGMSEVAKTYVTEASVSEEFIQPPSPHESKGKNDKNGGFECKKCWQIFLTMKDMYTHIREVHSSEYKFWCLKCNICFANKEEFQTHELVHSGPYHCKYCNKPFRYSSNLNRHERTHGGYEKEVKSNDTSEQHACIMCPKKFDDMSALKDHLFTHEDGNSFECLSCSKRFGQKDTLIRHCIQYDHVSTLL